MGKGQLHSNQVSRWLTRQSVPVALIAVFAVLLSGLLTIASAQSVREIDLECPCSHSSQGGFITLNASKVTYNGTGRTGTLKLKLWATTTRYAGGNISGYVLAEGRLGELRTNEYFDSPSLTTPYTAPPDGTYYITMTVTEYHGGEDLTADFATFDRTITVGRGGPGIGPDPSPGDGEIDLECPCSHSSQGGFITLNASKVTYNGTGRTGTLKLKLWATTTRYAGGNISGYVLAEGRLGELRTNEYFDSPSLTTPYTAPPDGTYYITMTVTEHHGGEDLTADFATFDRTITVGRGGPGIGPGGAGGDSFSSRSGISGASGRVTGNNAGASKEFGEPNHAGNRGGASLWWSWTAPATGTVTFDTQGSDFDTLLAVYTGSSVGALTVVASDDDTIGRQSQVSFTAQQGVVYHIAVDGYSGATGSIVLNWSQAGGPGIGPGGAGGDSFSSRSGISGASGRVTGNNAGASKEFGEPNHAGNRGGASLWWSWTAPATGTVTFDTQGSDFDTLLAVYTGSSVGALTVVASDDDTIGRQSQVSFTAQQGVVYHIAVDGYSGATGSIVLNWSQAGGPGIGPGGAGGDSFSSRSGISGASGRVTGNNAGASKEFGEPNHAGNRGGASLWWSWTAPATGTVTFDTQGSDFDTLLAVYTGSSVGALTVVASDDDTIGRQSQVSFTAQQGVVYHIAVDGYSGATGSIVLNWSQAGGPGIGPGGAGGDSFSSRSGISGASGRVTGNNAGASKEFGEPNHAGNRGGASLWWSWTAPATGTVTFDTQGSDFDTLLAVYTGSSVGALTVVASDDDTIGRQSQVSFTAQQGVVYHIAVDGYSGATGSIVLNWSQAGGPGLGPGPGPDPGTPSDGICISGRTMHHTLADGHVAVGHEILHVATCTGRSWSHLWVSWTEKQQR